MRLRQHSLRTEQTYVDWIRQFILFRGKRHPDDLGGLAISAFLTHLAADRHVAANTQNQALSALLFVYQKFLQRKIGFLDHVERAKPGETAGGPDQNRSPSRHQASRRQESDPS